MNKIKQTLIVVAALALFVLGASFVYPETSSAANCGQAETAIISCSQSDGESGKAEDSGIWGVLILVINVMIGAIGIAALAGIIYGAVLYTSAGGNMEQTKKAMQIIANVAIGLIAFALMFTLLNFLVPGGVFN